MNLEAALGEIDRLSVALKGSSTAFAYQVLRPSEPFRVWCNTWDKKLFGGLSVSAPEVTSRFGIYIFTTLDNEVIYVGKATPAVRSGRAPQNPTRYHLGAEIWNKMCTPQSLNETLVFPSGPLVAKKALPENIRQALRKGDILVAAVEIQPWALAACVESYLDAAAFLADGKLPVANDRIG